MNRLKKILQEYWGYDRFLPLQQEAMQAILDGHDSVVVLPTGGGKSLCFQSPAMTGDGLVVVVSPLISLMKDQVDALRDCGIEAACLNSATAPEERWQIGEAVRAGSLKLLYVAPERLVTESFLEFLKTTTVAYFVVDEAHCISMWGHDFRPEYRALRTLKETFPGVRVHCYTATATEHVRQDIVAELGLDNPEILVGSFDRPNLVYNFRRRGDLLPQVTAILGRHAGESGIIYCIRRKDVDALTERLCAKGYAALPYHAGMGEKARKQNQDRFAQEEVEIIVATIAFGMGIDKSNVRYVIHAGMPKSLEHYLQESGRAGRDGLEAECHLLYSAGDYQIWRHIVAGQDDEVRAASLAKLDELYNVCTGVGCRHRAIVTHFGQPYAKSSCGACDVCLGGLDVVDNALEIGQKILSCVLRLDERFGAAYTAAVLAGSEDQRVLGYGHNRLSTWGILADHVRRTVHDWIEQLVEQRFLEKTGEYNILLVTETGRDLLAGNAVPKLLKPAAPKKAKARARVGVAQTTWEDVDEGLFEVLRQLRRDEAAGRRLRPYMVFTDVALRDMARKKPTSKEAFLAVAGVGKTKAKIYAGLFCTAIREYCTQHALETDVGCATEDGDLPGLTAPQPRLEKAKDFAFKLFEQGSTIPDVAAQTHRAESTVFGYLEEYIAQAGLTEPHPWVSDAVFERVAEAVDAVGVQRFKTIHEFLDGEIDYADIRICVACWRNRELAGD